jgi:hypothetical protein
MTSEKGRGNEGNGIKREKNNLRTKGREEREDEGIT